MKVNPRPNSWTQFLIALLALAIIAQGALPAPRARRKTRALTSSKLFLTGPDKSLRYPR